jgi:hypothetical protein
VCVITSSLASTSAAPNTHRTPTIFIFPHRG